MFFFKCPLRDPDPEVILVLVLVLTPQGEPEPFEETNVDRLMSSLGFAGGSTGTGTSSLGVKAHRGSDSSTLSSQPSIDEVRTQMHMLLGNAFSLAPPDHPPPSPPTTSVQQFQIQNSSTREVRPITALKPLSSLVSSRHHHLHHAHNAYNPAHTNHYSDGVTSAPGTMNHPCGPRQRSLAYEDHHQCSLPKPVRSKVKVTDSSVCLSVCGVRLSYIYLFSIGGASHICQPTRWQ